MKTYVLMSAVALVLIPPAVTAQAVPQQRDTVKLSELVVTATRLRQRIADAPGSITVLRGSALRSSGSRSLADALRAVPGIAVAQSAGPGALTSLFIRGGESDYVQVLIDGVQVNEPGGSFDWAHMSTEDIERVEIVRGPASVLYGSDAVSGVIQIFTRAGGTHRIEAGLTASRGDKDAADADGSFDTRGFDASLTGGAPLTAAGGAVVQYGISAAHTTSTGLFAFNSDYDRTHVAGRVKLGGALGDIALTSRVADNEYHYPTSGSGAVIDRNQFSTGGSRSFSADAGFRLLAPVELRLLGTLHDTDSRTENPPDTTEHDRYWSTTDQQRRALDARVNIDVLDRHVLTLGAEREWQEAVTAFESVSGFGTFTDETHDTRTNTGWYAQLHGAPIDVLSLTLGARIDDNEKFGTFHTGRAALSWRITPALRVHGSLGTAFKEPTFYENFATAYSRGNPDLEPERADSRDAGVEYVTLDGRLTLGATYFEQRFRNLIQYTFNTPSPEDPNYFNVGAARARGMEASAGAALGALNATASYTHTATRVTDDGFGEDLAFQEGGRMLRRPQHQAAIHGSVRMAPALTALFDARYVGERDDLDFSDPEQWSGVRASLDAYTLLDAGIIYAVARGSGPDLDLSAGIRNLFDREYQEIRGFPTPGRVFYLGIRAGTEL